MRRQQQVEDYLSGKMTVEEKNNFELEMAQDESLAQLVAAQKMVTRVLKDKKAIAFNERLNNIRKDSNETVKKNTSPVFPIRRIISIAASLLLLIGVSYFLYNASSDSKATVIAQFELEPTLGKDELSVFKTRGENEIGTAEADWSEVLAAIKSGDIILTNKKLNSFKIDNPDLAKNLSFDFYQGVANYQAGTFEDALFFFSNIETSSRYYPDALWFSVGAYLKSGNSQKAKELLNRLIELNKGDKTHLAEKALKDLN